MDKLYKNNLISFSFFARKQKYLCLHSTGNMLRVKKRMCVQANFIFCMNIYSLKYALHLFVKKLL